MSDETRCEIFTRALGVPADKARELCADRLMQRCTRVVSGKSSSQDQALEDLAVCYGRAYPERRP